MQESRQSVREMLSVSEAREEILRRCSIAPIEHVPLKSAAGRILREHVVADIDIPPFDNSAMDGYAVSLADFDDQSAVLTIHEEIPAGKWPTLPVGAGACSRIMTGAPIPGGTDAVVPVEWCEESGGVGETVRILRKPDVGQHVRKHGSDIKKGDTALLPSTPISPFTVGVLASLGYASVSVSARPSVSIVTTGDELVDASVIPHAGQIRNSNGPTLAAVTESSGAMVVGQYVARDDMDDTRKVLEEAMRAEIVVVSGGVSVGSFDYVKTVLDEMGIDRVFWRVRQRPGKPLTFGTLGDKLIFGLPGNPVSTAVCFRQYILPAVRAILGLPPGPNFVVAELKEQINKVPSLHYFVPGRASVNAQGGLVVATSGTFGSHIFSSLAAANCLISIPEGHESVEPGSQVDVDLFDTV